MRGADLHPHLRPRPRPVRARQPQRQVQVHRLCAPAEDEEKREVFLKLYLEGLEPVNAFITIIFSNLRVIQPLEAHDRPC